MCVGWGHECMNTFYVDTNAYCMIGLEPKWFAATVRRVDTTKGVHFKVSVSKANTHTHSLLVPLIHMAAISLWYALYRMIILTKFIVIQRWDTKMYMQCLDVFYLVSLLAATIGLSLCLNAYIYTTDVLTYLFSFWVSHVFIATNLVKLVPALYAIHDFTR